MLPLLAFAERILTRNAKCILLPTVAKERLFRCPRDWAER
jgi:hypothetical protein